MDRPTLNKSSYCQFSDPNTQILYACDSCGDKFLDASSLAQHVRIHTAQALVMFQADSDYYQYATATTAEGDASSTWQPTAEHVIQEGELIFRPPDQEEGAEGEVIHEAGDTKNDTQTEGKDKSGEGESQGEEMECQS